MVGAGAGMTGTQPRGAIEMASVSLNRRRTTLWPWLAGLALLGLLIWAIGAMLDLDGLRSAASGDTEASTTTASTADQPVVSITEILPLGPEDRGRRVELRGSVIGEPIGEGVWIRFGDEAIFAALGEVPEDRPAQVDGYLAAATGDRMSAWIQQARLPELPEYAELDIVKTLVLRATPEGAGSDGAG
jgi:hypothetical protein